jgi:hypothetical protein
MMNLSKQQKKYKLQTKTHTKTHIPMCLIFKMTQLSKNQKKHLHKNKKIKKKRSF